MILAYVMSLILSVLSFIAWFTIVFAAKFPDSLFNPARAANAYITRASAYFLLMTEDWPPFSLDGAEARPGGRDQQRGGQPPGLTVEGPSFQIGFRDRAAHVCPEKEECV